MFRVIPEIRAALDSPEFPVTLATVDLTENMADQAWMDQKENQVSSTTILTTKNTLHMSNLSEIIFLERC